MADKSKFVVLFTSGNFIFFKQKNDKGVYCPKSILNSSRVVLKDDIYDLTVEPVTAKHKREYSDMPEAAVMIATRAKFVKTPRVIHGVGTMKKLSQDGEYGFVEYQDGKTTITAFCTRVTVKPVLDKGGMTKFFSTGCKVKFVAKEQPPSGMFNIEWRVVVATDMKHEISETNFEKVTPVAAAVPRPVAVAAAAAATAQPASPARHPAAAAAASMPLPPGLQQPPAAAAARAPLNSLSSCPSASSSSSSVSNGVSYAARAASQLPPQIPEGLAAEFRAVTDSSLSSSQLSDESFPVNCPDPLYFALTEREQASARQFNFNLDSENSVSIYDTWNCYKSEENAQLEAFEAELCALSKISTALFSGETGAMNLAFTSRILSSGYKQNADSYRTPSI